MASTLSDNNNLFIISALQSLMLELIKVMWILIGWHDFYRSECELEVNCKKQNKKKGSLDRQYDWTSPA